MDTKCPSCKKSGCFVEFGSGFASCMKCGDTRFSGFSVADVWSPSENLVPRASYTRRKRFKKYLNRACQQQTVCTVPDATWQYLLENGPYRTPRDIIRKLKAAKNLKRKCYDSLPVLARNLCVACTVPLLSKEEQDECLRIFDKIDKNVPTGQPFVSYLYTLEYCLHKIERQDILPFLSRIQCRKRRARYNVQLNNIFGTPCSVPEIVYM